MWKIEVIFQFILSKDKHISVIVKLIFLQLDDFYRIRHFNP